VTEFLPFDLIAQTSLSIVSHSVTTNAYLNMSTRFATAALQAFVDFAVDWLKM